jgi:hypothetical protein
VKLVTQVRPLPTPVQAAALEATLRACDEAADWVIEVAFARGEFKNFALRGHTYEQVKSRWNLGAQAARHVIKKACDAYTTLRANLTAGRLGRPGSQRHRRAAGKPVALRPLGAQPYDDRMLSWQIQDRRVPIWTTGGRMKCRSCGFVDHADRNGSRNIRVRAWQLWRRGAQSTAPAPPPGNLRDRAGRKRNATASGDRCANPSH